MSEQTGGQESTAPATGAGADAAAALALNGASRAEADAFLKKQGRLVELQTLDLMREDKLRHWSLRVRHVSDVLKLSLELAAALIVTAIVIFIGASVLSATRDQSLVIESFDVPSDWAARGLSGKVAAGQFLHRLVLMQDATDTARPANSYQNSWGDDFRVQIPDTGVSLGEATRYLHEWLGHETRISGEIYRTAKGIALTTWVGGASTTFEGPESSADTLMQKAAEAVYVQTQPYRCGTYFVNHGRLQEAQAVYQSATASDSANERAWAFLGLRFVKFIKGDYRGAISDDRKALALVPQLALTHEDLMEDLATIGHDEESLAEANRLLPLLRSPGAQIAERVRRIDLPYDSATRSFELGDFDDAVAQNRVAEQLADYSSAVESAHLNEIEALGFQHDSTGVAGRVRELSPANTPVLANAFDIAVGRAEFGLGNLTEAIRRLGRAQAFSKAAPKYVSSETDVSVTPLLATAEAEIGHHADAFHLIEATPLDCMWCVLMRGRIDEVIGNTKRAAYWYAEAEKQAPSLPMPETYWGHMLLARGRIDEAIGKFRMANLKSPHFADPLEMWGEALMAKNRSDLALAKFEEADRYAPRWGRLHLEWGEALLYVGNREEAAKQFVIASHLDLSQSDRSNLARVSAGHA